MNKDRAMLAGKEMLCTKEADGYVISLENIEDVNRYVLYIEKELIRLRDVEKRHRKLLEMADKMVEKANSIVECSEKYMKEATDILSDSPSREDELCMYAWEEMCESVARAIVGLIHDMLGTTGMSIDYDAKEKLVKLIVWDKPYMSVDKKIIIEESFYYRVKTGKASEVADIYNIIKKFLDKKYT